MNLPPGRVHLSVPSARSLGEAAMRGVGYDETDAVILADHALDAALCGYEYSGLPKLLNIVEAGEFRLPRQPISVLRDTGNTILIDGGNNTGMVAAYRATTTLIERATTNGLALVCLANTWMTGRSAYYCEMLARAGLVSIHTVASPKSVAPFGGTRPALGTNPIAFGFPTESDPLVIDLGTSAITASELQFRERLGLAIPTDVALGPDGMPTSDPSLARNGALLPFGGPTDGYKGFGLALAMSALGALSAAVGHVGEASGFLFIAFKPDLFLSPDQYRRELSQRIQAIKATPTSSGKEQVRIPGERSYRTRERSRVEGIQIDKAIHDALERLAERA